MMKMEQTIIYQILHQLDQIVMEAKTKDISQTLKRRREQACQGEDKSYVGLG